jgi:hypothetical protein
VGFLGQGIDQVHTLRQAFGQLAQSVIQSIQQIVAQLLVQIAFEKILAAIKKSSSGDGNDAAIGGNVGGAVGGILNLLSSAAATGATGGFVRGPGTSTSDSIPAWLSDGEFVVRASAVQQIGVPALMAINRGIHVPAIASVHGPRFADGGLVTGAGTGSDGAHITMGIGLDEGLVLKHLSSKAAGRVILQHIGANPKAANAGLQGRR